MLFGFAGLMLVIITPLEHSLLSNVIDKINGTMHISTMTLEYPLGLIVLVTYSLQLVLFWQSFNTDFKWSRLWMFTLDFHILV